MMITVIKRTSFLVILFFSITAIAQTYPDMTGVWKGRVRVVQSGNLGDRLDAGGAVISEIDLELTIQAQDGETFIGTSRTSGADDVAAIHVWGSIRSTGEEALFITSTGGHGQLWFESDDSFEYCYTALNDGSIISYCAKLTKE